MLLFLYRLWNRSTTLEVGEGKGEQQEAPRPVKRVRRDYFCSLKPQEPKSLQELTTPVMLKRFLKSLPSTTEKELEAIKANEAARDLLKQQAEKDPFMLHKAKSRHEVENILKLNEFLNLGITINGRNEYGETVFNALVGRGSIDGAEYLLETFGKDLDVSTPDVNGVTPLQRAIKRGDVALAEAIIKLLVEQNKSRQINTINNKGEETALLMAQYTPMLTPFLVLRTIILSSEKAKNIVSILEQKGNFQEALCIAGVFEGPDAMSEVIKHGANINKPIPLSFWRRVYSFATFYNSL